MMNCDCEPARFYSQKIRLSRTFHKCCECSLPIVPGEKYEYVSVMVDSISTHKTCLKCAAVRDWLDTQTECCVEFGGLMNEAIESGIVDRFDKNNWFVTSKYVNKVQLSDGNLRLKYE